MKAPTRNQVGAMRLAYAYAIKVGRPDAYVITEAQVLAAVEKLNHRPRKVLGFRTPHEVFFGVEIRYTKQPAAVALRT